jgi:uncharacterized membrane protein
MEEPMAKAQRKSKPNSKAQARLPLRAGPNWPLLALSITGVVLAGYLTYTTWMGAALAGCTAGSGCDVVLTSRWSTLFGFPTSFWGLLAYGSLAGIAFVKRADTHWQLAWSVALFGTLYSAYLTGVSLFVLEAACPYCLASLALMAAILALVSYQRPTQLPAFSWRPWLAKTVATTGAIVLGLHLHYIGVLGKPPAPEDPTVRALAEHLTASGAKFYGASWCPHCQDQKTAFGASESRLPYIECSPGGPRAPQAQECRAARIETYPTWVINGQRHVGVLDLKALADYSRFQGSAGSPTKQAMK